MKGMKITRNIAIVVAVCIMLVFSLKASTQADDRLVANRVVSAINALPTAHSGIPLIRGEATEYNALTNVASAAIDTTVSYQGMNPVKLTSSVAGGAGYAYAGKEFVRPVDISALKNFELLLWFYGDQPQTTLSSLRLDIQTNGGNYYYMYLQTTYWNGCPGVCRMRVDLSQFQTYGNPDLKNISGIYIRMNGVAGQTPSLGIFSVDYNAKSTPKVLLTFDDGWQDNYDYAYPVLKSFGYKGTVYVVSDFVKGTSKDYMRGTTLDKLYWAGWDIGNHASYHQNYSTGEYTADQMASYYKECANYLMRRGYNRSAYLLCYPDGAFDDALIAAVKKVGAQAGRTTRIGFNAPPEVDIYKQKQVFVGATTTFGVDNSAGDIKRSIDLAVSTGQTLFIMMHRVTPESQLNIPGDDSNSIKTSVPKLTQICQYLKQLGVEVCTMSQWYKELGTERYLSLNDKAAVAAARTAYDKLTPSQKLLVTNYTKLVDVEARMASFIKYANGVTMEDPYIVANKTAATNTDVTLSVRYDTSAVSKLYSMDGGTTWLEYSGPVVFSVNGQMMAKSKDKAGNMSGVTTYVVSNIDKVPPQSPTFSYKNTGKGIELTINYSSDSVIKRYSTDEGKTYIDYTGPILFTADCNFKARSCDAAGNWCPSSYGSIDTTPPYAPVITLSTTVPTCYNVGAYIRYSYDSVVKQYSIDGGKTWQDYTAAVIFSSNGTIQARAQDAYGNWSAVSSMVIDNIDKTPPTSPTYSASTTTSTTGPVTLTINYSSDSVVKKYSLDGGATYLDYTGPIVFTANGNIKARSQDAAGNWCASAYYTVSNIKAS